MNPSILIVDDQRAILDNIKLALEVEGLHVWTALDGVEALEVLARHKVDLILADIAMPRMNGYQLYIRVQQNPAWVLIPFLFLTARTMDSDIRYGKELGVDDYLTKPIEPENLIAAVRGKLRRSAQRRAASAELRPSETLGPRALVLGRLQIDPGQYKAWLDNKPIKLSAREFTLLEHLARRVREVASPQELIKITHGIETDPSDASGLLRPLIRSLRRKLGYPVGEPGCIRNVRGVGYQLFPPEGP